MDKDIELQKSNKKARKPLHKRWWFWLLIIFLAIFVLPVIMFGFSDSGSPTHLSKAAKIAKNNWKANKIEFADGAFQVDNHVHSKMYSSDEDGFRTFNGGGILFTGKFTNKSNSNIDLTNWWAKHIEVRSYDENGYYSLAPVSYALKENGRKQSIARSQIIIRPYETVSCGINNVYRRGKDIKHDQIRVELKNHGKKVWMTDPAEYKTEDFY